MHTILLAKAIEADIARDAAGPARVGRLAELRRRRAARRARSTVLVPAPVRFERPATW